MKLLCFQAKRFRWKTHSKTLPQAADTAPPAVVSEIIEALSGLGPVTVTERVTTTESVQFGLPREVR